MNEFTQILEMIAQQLKSSGQPLEVLTAFPEQPRYNPQHGSLAVVGIQKVLLCPFGLENYFENETSSSGRRAQIWVKVSFCCTSGEKCWQLWQKCAEKLIFSSKLRVSEIECGEAAWAKSWGGVVLPVRLCCEFLISGSETDGSADKIRPEEFHIIRKGAI